MSDSYACSLLLSAYLPATMSVGCLLVTYLSSPLSSIPNRNRAGMDVALASAS